MKNFDNILEREYSIKLMKLSEVKSLINVKSDTDILKYYEELKIPNKILVDEVIDGEKTGKQVDKYSIVDIHNLYEFVEYKERLNLNLISFEMKKYVSSEKSEDRFFGRAENKVLVDKEEFLNDIESILIKNSEKERIQAKNFLVGIESSPIIIAKNGDKYDLIDGFYRVLFCKPDIDPVVIVKEYDELSDYDWFKLMVIYNSWKKENENSKKVFDRGFLFGLYTRFGIKIEDFISNEYRYNRNIFEVLLNYCSEKVSINRFFTNKSINTDIIIENSYFVNDIKTIGKFLKVVPDECFITQNYYREYTYTYSLVINYVIRNLSKIRLMNKNIKQKEFSEYIIKNLLENDSDFKKELLRINKMSVPGRIENALVKLYPIINKEMERILLY